MRTAHTSGPWKVTGFTVIRDNGNYQRIASLWEPPTSGPLRAEAEANARLIAAAPDMLAVLTRLLAGWDAAYETDWQSLNHDDMWETVRAITLKIKGEIDA